MTSAPSSAPTRATCFTISTACSLSTFSPLGYIIAKSGMPHSSHIIAVSPRSSSISASLAAPTFTCIDTASAPNLIASSTVATITLFNGSGANEVLADRCIISPISLPYPRWPAITIPLCTRTAFAPPSAIAFTATLMSVNPYIGPDETP